MKCRLYKYIDYEDIKNWYESHGEKSPPRRFLPKNGYVVDGIAAGFLFRTDADLALVEGFISNKVANAKQKRSAFDMISHSLINRSKELGYDRVVAFSARKSTKRLCLRFGFKYCGEYSCLVKGL